MAEMVSTTVSFPKWTLTTDADMELCADELFRLHRVPSVNVRAWDHDNTDIRKLTISHPDPDTAGAVNAQIGDIVILLNGSPEALSPADYAARGYTG